MEFLGLYIFVLVIGVIALAALLYIGRNGKFSTGFWTMISILIIIGTIVGVFMLIAMLEI